MSRTACLAVAVLAVVAGCGKSSPPVESPAAANQKPAPSPEADCEQAAAALARRETRDLPRDQREEARKRLARAVAARCRTDAWSEEARVCFARTGGRGPGCAGDLTDDQSHELHAVVAANTAPPPRRRPRPARPALDEAALQAQVTAIEQRLVTSPIGVPECDRYMHLLVFMARCDKLPIDARGQIVASIEQVAEAWGQAGQQPSGTQAAGDACRQAIAALDQSMSAMGCGTPGP